MLGDANTETNQTPATIQQPEESPGVENPPELPQSGEENVPPPEVPGRNQTPGQIPEKGRKTT